jgi:hypothetical protein
MPRRHLVKATEQTMKQEMETGKRHMCLGLNSGDA